MSNCFEVLARSAIVSTKRESCDQLGQGYASPLHNVKLEWSSEMSSSCDEGYEPNPYQFLYMGDSLNGRRGLNHHQQHYYSKQVIQGGAFMSANGVMKEPLGMSTESSLVFNAWSSSDEGSLVENTRTNQMKGIEEQWCVDVLASGSMVIPSSLFQQENIRVNSCVEFGFPGQHVEDLQPMLHTEPADPTIMKWLLSDGHTHGQGEIQPAQSIRQMDSVIFEHDLSSSSQHQLGQQLGDDPRNRQILHELSCRDSFSSLPSSSIIHSPASSEPSFGTKFLLSHTSLPRALFLPAHGISLNSPNRTGASASRIAVPFVNMDEESGGHMFSAPTSFVGATHFSPTAPTAEYCAQNLHFGNSISENQPSHRNTFAVNQTSLVVEEGPFIIRGSLSASPPSVQSLHSNLPSCTPASYRQETDQPLEQGSTSYSSLAISHSPDQLIISPSVISSVYPNLQQLSWNKEKNQLHQTCSEHGSLSLDIGRNLKTSLGAFSPMPCVPSFNVRAFKHTGSSSCQVGDEQTLEDAKLDTGQIEEGVIPEGGLVIVNLLLRAAEAVDIGNVEMAKVILARLNQCISSSKEKSIHRVAHYFCEALVTRIFGVDKFAVHLSQDRTLSSLEEFHKINAYVRFCEVSPYPKFAHFTANQAILEVLEGEKAMHVIDFQMGAGAQWASFLQDIASLRAAGKLVPSIRLTAVGTRADEIHATGANLCNFARMLNISLEFQAVVTRPECLDVSMLGLRDSEAVAGNFIFSLHELLDEGKSDGLSAVLRSVLDARPRVVTTVEQEANHSSPFFQQRFSEALQYYVFLFDSLTSSLKAGADSSANSSIESYLLAPEIMNIVACDGVSRVERHERLEQWRDRMLAAGFSPRPLSDVSQFQAEKLIAQISVRRGFQVTRDQGGLLLGWQGRPLLAASSWIC